MLWGLIGGLLVGWILSWFGVDTLIINGLKQLINPNITHTAYYCIFALIGALGGANTHHVHVHED
jgi:NhaP-type Na+/H+ or K+/H+ antiporter